MKKNKMLSLAAAMVLTSTSVMAFDAIDINATSGINIAVPFTIQDRDVTKPKYANYKAADLNASSVDQLQVSANSYGDALIYPAFKADSTWSTEISVRNKSTNTATVAKVVVYSADKSEELLDFNIYLSKKDVFKFTIDADGNVISSDGSAAADYNEDAKRPDQVTMITDGTSKTIGNINTTSNGSHTAGYVAIYAMAETNSTNSLYDDNVTPYDPSYHNNHAQLWKDYRLLLDGCRENWREMYQVSSKTNGLRMINGMQIKTSIDDRNVTSPNVVDGNFTNFAMPTGYGVARNCGDFNRSTLSGLNPNTNGAVTNAFNAPTAQLTGEVRITATGDASRDLLLQATPLANFTDQHLGTAGTTADTVSNRGQMILWADGELASITDRRLDQNGSLAGTYFPTIAGQRDSMAAAVYDKVGIDLDSTAFDFATIDLQFNTDHDKETTILLTQPYKRHLVQLRGAATTLNGINLGTGVATLPGNRNIFDGSYGDFKFSFIPYDLKEGSVVPGTGSIVSPYSTSAQPYDQELQTIELSAILADAAAAGSFTATQGFIEAVPVGSVRGIVTQMNGSSITGDEQTNWSYTPTR